MQDYFEGPAAYRIEQTIIFNFHSGITLKGDYKGYYSVRVGLSYRLILSIDRDDLLKSKKRGIEKTEILMRTPTTSEKKYFFRQLL